MNYILKKYLSKKSLNCKIKFKKVLFILLLDKYLKKFCFKLKNLTVNK